MLVTVVSHAGIANRIKNIMSAMSQYENVGTYDSTFDEVAWWMSGCKSKVIIPTPKNFDQNYHDSQRLKK